MIAFRWHWNSLKAPVKSLAFETKVLEALGAHRQPRAVIQGIARIPDEIRKGRNLDTRDSASPTAGSWEKFLTSSKVHCFVVDCATEEETRKTRTKIAYCKVPRRLVRKSIVCEFI
jgi:hypothetical protein